MSYTFTVSPDFSPDHISGWYIFNTWLQRQTGEAIHLEMFNDFDELHAAIHNDQIDLIYANPYDAAMLVREKGFLPVAKAAGESDEAIIAVAESSAVNAVEELKQGVRVAYTDDPDVRLMGMIMLEPADLNSENITPVLAGSYPVVAKHLLKNEADVGIFLAEAFDDLSNLIKNQLKVLVRSQISVIHHALLVGPKFQHQRDAMTELLTAMHHDEKGVAILKSLGFSAWEKVDDEETEFMIDLMDTLAT